TLEASASLTNQNGGVIDATSGGAVTVDLGHTGDVNAGTIKADSGTGKLHITIDGDVNDGTVEALNGGSVTINTNGTNSSTYGLIEATSGGTVTINGGSG